MGPTLKRGLENSGPARVGSRRRWHVGHGGEHPTTRRRGCGGKDDVFCPNCGTQNADTATTCTKCGFNLKGAAAPKFKGTMLMMNAPAAVPRAPGPSGTPGG